MKGSKNYFWSVSINVTTGIIKEGYSSPQSSWNPIYDNRFSRFKLARFTPLDIKLSLVVNPIRWLLYNRVKLSNGVNQSLPMI